ncbi:2OG-Fe(II) oxygenase family oxidoreductase [Lentithecium fluviatile CBS 122367]|uniref:2OG-Fe(II) oxygenase family oxidoreductase n=1 Tax=Lentithecium fluviatile CBS 122367 TaxID=1168545 RepID=A0A6G1J3B0_9PLEO|nr:2OG-Fe(II) oxygenase family oxidoreductase [Lentithecium fluviatile CBS 122367]
MTIRFSSHSRFRLAPRAGLTVIYRRYLNHDATKHTSAIPGSARLKTVDLSGLRSRELSETGALLRACEEDGFFYLDIRRVNNAQMIKDWMLIQSLMQPWFARPFHDKMRYHCGTFLHGYTPVGTYAGLLENSKDGNESIKITDVARRVDPPILPDLYLENRALLDRFMDGCRDITISLLSSLSDSLDLRESSRFEQSHRSYMPANTCLNLFNYPKSTRGGQFGQNKHTDNGSLTLLFANQQGLEILSPRTSSWDRVLPRDGHVVVNVGDTLRFLSGNRFHSSIHRAAPIFEPSQQGRLVAGFFLRAEDHCMIEDNEGSKMTARQWHDHKYDIYKSLHSIQRTSTVLTGGMEEHIDNAKRSQSAAIETREG